MIRAVQAVLNATKGKIGRGKSFFEEAFGKDEDGYFDILWMPETFIIERMKHKENLTREWHDAFHALTGEAEAEARMIIARNDFSEAVVGAAKHGEVREVLQYYMLQKVR